MEWLQAFMIAGSTIGSCYWILREHKADFKEHKSEIKSIIDEMNRESKDFHGRMCALEERYLQMMQKHLEDRK